MHFVDRTFTTARIGVIIMALAGSELICIGQNIRARRKLRQLTQDELSKSIGVSSNYVSMIENGKEQPSLPLFFKICHVLETTPNDLASFDLVDKT